MCWWSRAQRAAERGLFQVGADEIDELFAEFGRHGAGADVQADVVLEDFGHEAVDAALYGGEEHEDVGAVLVLLKAALDGLQLALNPLGAVDELGAFAVDLHRTSEGILPFFDTLPGYEIRKRGEHIETAVPTLLKNVPSVVRASGVLSPRGCCYESRRANGQEHTTDSS